VINMHHADAVAALAAATTWRKASFSGTNGDGGCVEVATVPGWVGVRDTKLGPDSPILAFTPHEWDAFAKGVRDGEFELPDRGSR
jgi:hypothetical protein